MLEPTSVTPESAQPDSGPGADRSSDPKPVIVIEYRQRGLVSRLTPPALILLAALAISSYQRRTPLRPIASRIDLAALDRLRPGSAGPAVPPPRIEFRPQAGEQNPAPASVVDAPAPRVEKPADVVQATPPAPLPQSAPPAAPASAPAPSPFDLEPVAGLEPATGSGPSSATPPPAASDAANADPRPEAVRAEGPPAAVNPPDGEPMASARDDVSRDDILRDIQREADEKTANFENLERLKPRAQALLAVETVERINGQRIPFRNDLRQLLKERGVRAGKEIDSLCDQYGRDTPQEIKSSFYRALMRIPTRMSRPEKVEMMRMYGIPEPTILDTIARDLHKTMNTRGGPRDEEEVRVRAAWFLLNIPVGSARRPVPRVPDSRPPGVGQAAQPSRPTDRPPTDGLR